MFLVIIHHFFLEWKNSQFLEDRLSVIKVKQHSLTLLFHIWQAQKVTTSWCGFFFFLKVDFGMSESDHLASDLPVALQGPRMSENTQRRKKELIISHLLWVKLYAWQFTKAILFNFMTTPSWHLITPILQMSTLRLTEVKYYYQVHTTGRWESLGLSLDQSYFKALLLSSTFYRSLNSKKMKAECVSTYHYPGASTLNMSFKWDILLKIFFNPKNIYDTYWRYDIITLQW